MEDGTRRRPVPKAWREHNHWLYVSSHYYAQGAIRGSRVYRARGRCSCGETWPKGERTNNLDRETVVEFWKDHVEDAYYAERVL